MGHWSDEEHRLFLEAIKIYGKQWREVMKYVGTRTKDQVRSHAQKYQMQLNKVEKNKKMMAKSDHINYTKELIKKRDMVVDYWNLDNFDHHKYQAEQSIKLIHKMRQSEKSLVDASTTALGHQ